MSLVQYCFIVVHIAQWLNLREEGCGKVFCKNNYKNMHMPVMLKASENAKNATLFPERQLDKMTERERDEKLPLIFLSIFMKFPYI